jgi:hypothetical protein
MKHIFLVGITFMVFATTYIFGAFEPKPLSARQMALLTSGVANTRFISDLESNPASVSIKSPLLLDLGFTRLYGLKDLQYSTISIGSFRSKYIVAGFLSSFGTGLYRETVFRLSLSYSAQKPYAIGLAVNYNHLSIVEYGRKGYITFQVGAQVRVVRNVYWGFTLKHMNNVSIGKMEDPFPREFVSGVAYQWGESFEFRLEHKIQERFLPSLIFSGEKKWGKFLILRGGITSYPVQFGLGTGIRFGTLQFDYGIRVHKFLPVSQMVSISYVY